MAVAAAISGFVALALAVMILNKVRKRLSRTEELSLLADECRLINSSLYYQFLHLYVFTLHVMEGCIVCARLYEGALLLLTAEISLGAPAPVAPVVPTPQ